MRKEGTLVNQKYLSFKYLCRNNHDRVKRIHLSLVKRGINSWFDEEKLMGKVHLH